MDYVESVKLIARFVFEPLPAAITKQYNKTVFDYNYTLQEQFIAYCLINSLVPKTLDRVKVQTMAVSVWDKYIYDDSETFVIMDENGKESFDFSKFLILFQDIHLSTRFNYSLKPPGTQLIK